VALGSFSRRAAVIAKASFAPPAFVMETLSIVVSQHYMVQINSRLDTIEQSVMRLEARQQSAVIGSLRACLTQVYELEEELCSLRQLPSDFEIRLAQLNRDATQGLCQVESNFGTFVQQVEAVAALPERRARVKAIKVLEALVLAAETDLQILIAHVRLNVRLRQLLFTHDTRHCPERAPLSQQRLMGALSDARDRLQLLNRLEVALETLQDAVESQWWLSRHVTRRGSSKKVREILQCIDTVVHQSSGSGQHEVNSDVVLAGTYMLQWRNGCLQASVLSLETEEGWR